MSEKYANFPRDLTGIKFGRLTVLRHVSVSAFGAPSSRSQWETACECGGTKISPRYNLIANKTQSCGCLARELISKRNVERTGYRKHGAVYRMPEYSAYATMIRRCNDEKSHKYPSYGAIGVRVCDRWLESFANFIADMGRKPSPIHSLDRIDPFGNYEKSNCRWATPKEQARNKRTSKITMDDAEQMRLRRASGETLKSIAQDYGVHLSLVSLVAKGKVWSHE